MVAATGARDGQAFGFTFSDLTQRLLPTILLDAFPERPVDGARALALAKQMLPTPPFQDNQI